MKNSKNKKEIVNQAKLSRVLKSSLLGPQNLGSGGPGSGPQGPPGSTPDIPVAFHETAPLPLSMLIKTC